MRKIRGEEGIKYRYEGVQDKKKGARDEDPKYHSVLNFDMSFVMSVT